MKNNADHPFVPQPGRYGAHMCVCGLSEAAHEVAHNEQPCSTCSGRGGWYEERKTVDPDGVGRVDQVPVLCPDCPGALKWPSTVRLPL